MNSWNGTGRLTRDPELRYAQKDNKEICKFGIAIKRSFGEGADFLNCVAFGKTAELISTHFHKGKEIGITGRIQTGSFDGDEGKKIYTTDIIIASFDFIGSKKDAEESKADSDNPFNPSQNVNELRKFATNNMSEDEEDPDALPF